MSTENQQVDGGSASASASGGHRGNTGKNGGLPLVPEHVLKRKHDVDEMKARRAAKEAMGGGRGRRGDKRVFSATHRVIRVQKPETILSRARMRRNHSIRYTRVWKKGMQTRASHQVVRQSKTVSAVQDDDDDDDERTCHVHFASNSVGARLVFVVRIRNAIGLPRNVKKTLSALGLVAENQGLFVQYNAATRRMLHLVEPWVRYGVPSKSIITELIKQRGHGKINGERIPLSDNTVIEDALGKSTGIICVEDLVHELHTVGPHFNAAASFLWPFSLTAVKSKFQQQTLGSKEGGDYGDQGEEMDEVLRQML